MASTLLPHSPGRRLLRLGAATAGALAFTLALAAALGVTGIDVALDGCLGLALIAAATRALLRSGLHARIPAADFVFAQAAVVFLLLAWLGSRAGDALTVLPALYLLAMVYPMLQLDRARLAVLGAVALIAYGTALFMRIDAAGSPALPALWLQLGALLAAFALLIYAAEFVQRLRGRLSDVRRSLHELGMEAEERASRDALTGVYHHRHLMEALEREISRAERLGKTLCVARVDLEGLGALNDAHGHAAGDVALRRFAAAAGGALRDVDVLGRTGGKEFLAILPDTDLKGAVIAAERVRAAVAREPVPEVGGRRHLGCTLGVAEHRKGENTRLVLGRAEAGLSYAKAAGRDLVAALGADGKPVLGTGA